jgi:hypothetical protein
MNFVVGSTKKLVILNETFSYKLYENSLFDQSNHIFSRYNYEIYLITI